MNVARSSRSSEAETAYSLEGGNAHNLGALIEAIGHQGFVEKMLGFLHELVSANHCAIYQREEFELTEVGSAGLTSGSVIPKSELTPYEVKRHLSQLGSFATRVDVCAIAGSEDYRDGGVAKRQRVMICARRQSVSYCVRLLRLDQQESVSDEEIEQVRAIADLLISLVVRHIDLSWRRPNLTPALTSLDEIYSCMVKATDLSRREGEVCARILYGLSSCGIALDLGIGKESVMTYRKRAYQRLGIGSQRELLMWYLGLWSTLRGRNAAPLAAAVG